MASEIGVQTIQHTNGTDAMTIDSSGRVLTPARPAFYATRTSNWNDISSAIQTIPFDTENFDVGSNYNTSNYKFTAPVTGIYSFSWHIRLQNIDTASSYFQVFITDQDGNYADSYTYDSDSTWASDVNYFSFGHTTLQQLTAGNTRELKIFIPNGHTTTDIYGTQSYFCGHLVG